MATRYWPDAPQVAVLSRTVRMDSPCSLSSNRAEADCSVAEVGNPEVEDGVSLSSQLLSSPEVDGISSPRLNRSSLVADGEFSRLRSLSNPEAVGKASPPPNLSSLAAIGISNQHHSHSSRMILRYRQSKRTAHTLAGSR